MVKGNKKESGGGMFSTPMATPEQALIANIAAQGFYALSFFGFQGNPHEKFFGTPATAGPLCNKLPFWMGLCNVAFVLGNLNAYKNGSENDKKQLNNIRGFQWTTWLCMLMMAGRQSFGGLMVDKEYFIACGVCFIMAMVSWHGSHGHKAAPITMDISDTVTRCFMVFWFFGLFNTYNIGLMGGEKYFEGEADQMTRTCRTDGAFFTSFVYLLIMDTWIAMQGFSDEAQKGYFMCFMAMNAIFAWATYSNRDLMDDTMVMMNYAVNGVQLAVAYYGYSQFD